MIALLLLAAQAAAATPAVAARIERLLARTPVVDGHNDLAWEIGETQAAKVESLI